MLEETSVCGHVCVGVLNLSLVPSAEHVELLCPARDTGAEDRIDVSLANFST